MTELVAFRPFVLNPDTFWSDHPTRSFPGAIVNTRRQFLIQAPLGLLGVAAACRGETKSTAVSQTAATPGTPPAFGTLPEVGPQVSPATFREAEKLMQITMSDAERTMAAASWRRSMAAMLERRTGPRTVNLGPEIVPATRWNPVLPGPTWAPRREQFVRSRTDPGALPAGDDAIAYAPVTRLSRWI